MLNTVAIFAVIATMSVAPAQTANAGCELIDSNVPAVNLSYSISQAEFARQGQVGLTLHNNTTCLLLVESNGASDAAALRIIYDIQDARRTRVPSHKEIWVDSNFSFYNDLPPGKSLSVAVDKTHVKKKLTISVRYLFSWEKDGPASGDFEHRVYFDSSYWPKTRR